MPIQWTAEMDRKLFLAGLDTSAITIDNTAVAAQLTTEDQPCTPMAIQKRLQKLKTMVKAGTPEDDDGATKINGMSTPKKRGACALDGETPAKRGKKAVTKNTPDSEVNDEHAAEEVVGIKQELGDASD